MSMYVRYITIDKLTTYMTRAVCQHQGLGGGGQQTGDMRDHAGKHNRFAASDRQRHHLTPVGRGVINYDHE